ncbi:MAG TPA: Gfo/Idh/MocA family oxidoreductase [Clostridiaceae bacterium]|nr:Gfo/Idh/MocA family oxidoreductase [Clostridiaceae bacterium]
MKKIRAGVIGMGFIGVSHVEAIRRIGFAELVAVADVNYELAKKKADEYNIPKCYSTVEELLADESIDVVHNCTPNNLHLEINEKIIKAGKHVFSEKPLARTSEESSRMLQLLSEYKNIIHGVNFNYRMNPLVQDMKNKIKNGEIGKPYLVHGSYLQDWLLFDTDYNWRIEPEISGPSRCIADIGSHWMDAVQTVLNAKITEVCADLVTVIPVRKKPKGQVETFSISTSTDYEEREITTEDYGAVLFKMDNGAHGVFYVSEVSAGRKCYFNFEINGSKASLYWNQETADHMWMGFRDRDNCHIIRNPNLMTPEAREYTYLAAGHPEGWNDALKNNVYSFYKFIAEGKDLAKDPHDFATFEEGHYILKLTEAILKSSEIRQWVKVE